MNITSKNINKLYKRFNHRDKEKNILASKIENDYLFNRVNIKKVIVPPNFVINKEEKKYLIHLAEKNQISLMEYIIRAEYLNEYELITIILNIGNLLKEINNKGYILGSIDLEDIWLTDNDLSTLFIRQRKSLFKKNDSNNIKYKSSSISAYAIQSERYVNLNEETDIELYGRIFMKLIIPNRDIGDYTELRYLAYNINLFNDKVPLFFKVWLDKITSINKSNRFKDINEAVDFIKSNYNKKIKELQEKPKYIYNCITHPGKGKITNLKDEDLEYIDNINQDSMFVFEGENRIFAMVADGVTNCTYGSGYKASNIIKQVCSENLIQNIDKIDEHNIYDFYKNLINDCNQKICDEILKLYSNDNESIIFRDIMASTFATILIKGYKAFITSIGDSKIFLYRDNNIFQINTSDNVGNEYLQNGMTWREYLTLNNKSALTKYIGYFDENNKNITDTSIPKITEIDLQSQDLIIICSDGLTDYMCNAMYRTDLWDINHNIKTIIEKNYDKNLEYINWKLVQQANFNGGGDNISSIIIKII